jgi:sodium transport system permease protein
MTINTTLAVARKELREIVRDRRSLLAGLLYGVWGPLVMGMALFALARDRADEAPRLAVDGASQAPALMAFLEARGVAIVPLGVDARQALRDRRAPAVLTIHEEYGNQVAASRPAEVALSFDSAWPTSARHAARVQALLSEYGQRVRDSRLLLHGVAPDAVRPLRVQERDYATAAARASTALATLPIFLLLSAFVGGMGAAADVTAGERERGSLESLLVHPAPRAAIVLGKWVAVAVVTLATVAITVLVSGAVLSHPRLQGLDLPIGMSPREAATIAGVLVPLALATAAVQMFLALRTESYKEAQTLLSFMIFVPMVPGFLFAFGTLQPTAWMATTPMLGQHLLVVGLVRGDPPTAGPAAILSIVTLGVGGLALLGCAQLLRRETVLRRTRG